MKRRAPNHNIVDDGGGNNDGRSREEFPPGLHNDTVTATAMTVQTPPHSSLQVPQPPGTFPTREHVLDPSSSSRRNVAEASSVPPPSYLDIKMMTGGGPPGVALMGGFGDTGGGGGGGGRGVGGASSTWSPSMSISAISSSTSPLSIPFNNYDCNSLPFNFCGNGGSNSSGGGRRRQRNRRPKQRDNNNNHKSNNPSPLPNLPTSSSAVLPTMPTPSSHNQSEETPLPDVNEMEQLIVKELNTLTLQEREAVYDDIHGVAELQKETPTMLKDLITKMRNKLKDMVNTRTINTTAYEQALFLSPKRTLSSKLLLQFIRADLYDINKACKRYIDYYKYKLQLFGINQLVKDITYDECLTEDDKLALASGFFQLLPPTSTYGSSTSSTGSLERDDTTILHHASDTSNRPIMFVSHQEVSKSLKDGKTAVSSIY